MPVRSHVPDLPQTVRRAMQVAMPDADDPAGCSAAAQPAGSIWKKRAGTFPRCRPGPNPAPAPGFSLAGLRSIVEHGGDLICPCLQLPFPMGKAAFAASKFDDPLLHIWKMPLPLHAGLHITGAESLTYPYRKWLSISQRDIKK